MRRPLNPGSQVAGLTLAALACAPASAQDSYEYELIPLLWAASIDGSEGLGGRVVGVEEDFGDLLEFLDVGGAMRLVARRAPVTWFGEASYVVLEDTAATPGGGAVSVDATQSYGEAGLSYELNERLAAYGALRYQRLELQLTGAIGSPQGNKDWIDAVAGLQWTPIRSEAWLAWLRGDVGAGGSDLVWLADAGVGYRFAERWRVYVGYRLLDTDYNSGGFVYDVQQTGFALGVGFRL